MICKWASTGKLLGLGTSSLLGPRVNKKDGDLIKLKLYDGQGRVSFCRCKIVLGRTLGRILQAGHFDTYQLVEIGEKNEKKRKVNLDRKLEISKGKCKEID